MRQITILNSIGPIITAGHSSAGITSSPGFPSIRINGCVRLQGRDSSGWKFGEKEKRSTGLLKFSGFEGKSLGMTAPFTGTRAERCAGRDKV